LRLQGVTHLLIKVSEQQLPATDGQSYFVKLLTLMRETATLIVFDILVLTTLPTCCHAQAKTARC
jgi:hypothetical protein